MVKREACFNYFLISALEGLDESLKSETLARAVGNISRPNTVRHKEFTICQLSFHTPGIALLSGFCRVSNIPAIPSAMLARMKKKVECFQTSQ